MIYQKLQSTDLQMFVCVLVVYSLANVDFFALALQLLPVSIDQWEGSDVVLKCSNNQYPLRDVQWTCNTKVAAVYNASGTCGTFAGFLQDYPHLFSYNCTDGKEFTLTLKKLSRLNHSDTCFCQITVPGNYVTSNPVTIRVKVPIANAYINYGGNTLSSLENAVTSIQCYSSDCRPIPAFMWYIDKNTESMADDILLATNEKDIVDDTQIQSFRIVYNLQPNRTLNNWYLFCGGINRNDDTVLSRKIFLNISYSPDAPPIIRSYTNGSEIKVIQNMVVHLECVSTGGNPLPNLQWNKDSESQPHILNNTVTTTLNWKATGVTKDELRCYFIYNFTTYMTFVIVEILYPPEAIDVSLITDSDNTSSIKHNFSVIENTSSTLILICSARSNPSPNSYMWTGPIQSNSARLEINMARYAGGTYTCHANNTMIAHDGLTEQGYKSTPYTVEILQQPDIGRLQDANVVEGNNVSITCPIINGNDTWRSVTWLNKQSVQVGQNGSLFMKDVTRNANGTYTCQLNFTMQPSYGSQKIKTITKGFYLDVLYHTEILSLSINNKENSPIVNESARVQFVCKVDSNPNSTVEITFNNKLMSTKSNTKTLEFLIPFAYCNDTGTYVCTGNNTYNTGQRAVLNNTLFVLCSPRPSPSFKLELNVTSALNESATFHFTAMAYPQPRFQWYRVFNGSETSENHTGVITSHSISTNERQTNFTLVNVEVIQYGEYLLKAENQYGTYSQTFFLVAEGKPTPPTYYDFYPDLVTSDSVTIWWEPGFDGGLPQSFIISYNLTVSKWYNESNISQNKERQMNKTIFELASGSVYHILIYAQNKKGAVRVPHAIIVHTKESMSEELKINVGAAVGGAVGGLLAIVVFVVVAAVIIVRKRSLEKQHEYAQGETCDLKDSHTYTNLSKEIDTHKINEGDTAFLIETKQAALDLPKLPERMPMNPAATHHLQELDDIDDKANEIIYGNTYEMIKRIERINVSELLPYLTNKPTDFFGSEFSKLPTGLTKSYEFSQKTENIALNRYHGIYPYDHSRVKIADEPLFFINACYIDGYKKKKEFIASLGPLARTTFNFETFWKMVWSEKSDAIVMLTKLTEPSGVKCDPYWPKPESSQVYGDVTVTCVGEDVYSDYVLRNFTLSKGNERRKLIQFHFMAWPDKSIPEDVTCLLEFRKLVNANHASGPIIVHCSAGIGRTGTLIAIEILIEEGRRKGSVNVVECVKTMRDQRTSMVQTVDQYHYIYKALVNALVFDCESVKLQKFQKFVDKTNTAQFNKMFKTFNLTVEADSTPESNARTANKTYRDKNRIGSDIPGDSNRVRLFLNRDEETSMDYINAVFIDSFTKREHFIVAQSPMTNGVEDFLCMIYQVDCTCIVSLGDNQQGRNVGMYTPADNTKTVSIGCFNVSCKVLDTKDNYVVRKMKIEFKGKYESGEKDVYHFEYIDWAVGQKTPSDPQSFVQFTREVEEFASQLGTGKSQVLVHCLNAYERSCLFCATVTLVEKVKYEGEVCVSNTLRHIRARRRLAIPNMEQFQFCFRAVCSYINMETTGSSIEEKAYINMALA